MKSTEFTPKLFELLHDGIPAKVRLKEISCGLLIGIMALPLAIAFAVASGVSPDKGIVTAIIAGFVISFLGGSRVQIGGPTGAFVVIVFAIIQRHGFDGLLLATTMAGLILIVMGLLRLGTLIHYIPQTLVTGFTAGIAVLIFSSQINDFLGLGILGLPADFAAKWRIYALSLESFNPYAVALGLATILIVRFSPRFTPRIPGSFLALLATTVFTFAFHLPVDTIGSRFGAFDALIPPVRLPDFNLPLLRSLLLPAFSIALLGALESLLSALVADGVIGDRHRPNIELIAQGAANILSPLFGGIPATGAIARTMTNIKLGARTPISGMVHALTLAGIYLAAMPLIAYIPMAALAGILMAVAVNMSEYRYFIQSCRINGYETSILLTTFLLTLFTDLTIAIPVGFGLALVLFMKRMADSLDINPLVTVKPEENSQYFKEIEIPPHVLVFEISGPLFFGSVGQFVNIYPHISQGHSVVIFRMRYVPILDSSGLRRLGEIVHDLNRRGMKLMVSGATVKITTKLITLGIVPAEQIFPDFNQALLTLRDSATETGPHSPPHVDGN